MSWDCAGGCRRCGAKDHCNCGGQCTERIRSERTYYMVPFYIVGCVPFAVLMVVVILDWWTK